MADVSKEKKSEGALGMVNGLKKQEAKMSGEPKAFERERLEKIINDFSELYGGLYEGDGKNIVFSEHYQMASRLRWAEEEITRLTKRINELDFYKIQAQNRLNRLEETIQGAIKLSDKISEILDKGPK